MATGVPVNPWATSLTVVTPSSTAVTPPSTQTAPPPMDKAGFKKLIEFRRTLLVVTPERPFSSVVAERFQALVMTSGEITPQARADLSKALAAEDQRRKDLDVEGLPRIQQRRHQRVPERTPCRSAQRAGGLPQGT
jgi:hypothetical protein